MKYKSIAAVLAMLLVAASSQAQPIMIKLVIEGGKEDYKNVPICVPLSFPTKAILQNFVLKDASGKELLGQLTKPGLTTQHIKPKNDGEVRHDLHFILPAVKAGSSVTLDCSFGIKLTPVPAGHFAWAQKGDGTPRGALNYQIPPKTRPVLQYMHAPYDDSSEEARNKSYKVFHHLYDPSGTRFVTNGGHTDPHTDAKKLLFPHHRGIMYGFNKVTYGENKKADTWHCQKDDYLEHVKTLSQEAGPVLGRHRVLIDWHGSKEDIFAKEERELTLYAVPGGTLVEFASLLKTTGGKVKLDGDPQHAGFQFRAANEVAEKTAKQTYYLRVGGKGKPGQTINWVAKNPPKGTVDVPWKAMSFVLGDKRYTVAYLDHPKNPGEARHSERDYGRFGYYFEYELTEQNPLLVNYRLWLQNGEMTGEQVDALHKAFVSPPAVAVKK